MIKYYVRVSTVEQKLERQLLAYDKGFNKTELSKEFGVPRATIYRWEKVLKERGEL